MIKNRYSVIGLSALLLFSFLIVFATAKSRPVSENYQESESNTQWIASSLKQMQTVKVGMTRADLLKVFTTEGGLSTGLQRTYVYKQCRYIKVDVEFHAVGRPDRDAEGRVTLVESEADVITKISKPYLDWSVAD
ncbi:MAG TPA: hypothetical protein VFC63_22015 [Blastocatellia bacterium]|nr:hypothetical protein [Blastocatellia bacterium]